MPPTLDPQLALDETAITNPDLEAALERRLRASDDVAEARGVYKTADEEVKGEIAKIDFEPDSALRIGRFRITKRHVEEREVSFTSKARDQITIGLVEEDGAAAAAPAPRRSSRPTPVADDDVDLRPTGPVNADALRGEADRSVGFQKPKGGDQPPVTH